MKRAVAMLGAVTGALACVAASCARDTERSAKAGGSTTARTGADHGEAAYDDYLLVGANGATLFATPPDRPGAGAGALVPHGFGFAPAGESRTVGGVRYVRVHDGRWLAERDVTRARPSRFAGATLTSRQPLTLAWVVTPGAPVFAQPDAHSPRLGARARGTRVDLTSACRDGFCPVQGGWLRAVDLARPALAPRPADAGPVERWLDVDLTSQTLVAYQGDEPRFATLIAGGIGAPGSPLATPTGTFRLSSKQRLVRMDNLEHTGVEPYAFDVPLAQYFTDGKALHAAPWHDALGRPRSHGCVNLSPRDARWLFDFTSPALAPGADSVDAAPSRPGTLVRIRRQLVTALATRGG